METIITEALKALSGNPMLLIVVIVLVGGFYLARDTIKASQVQLETIATSSKSMAEDFKELREDIRQLRTDVSSVVVEVADHGRRIGRLEDDKP